MISGRDIYKKIVNRKDLSAEESKELFDLLMEGKISPQLASGILTALLMKGESVDEIYGAVQSMREHCQNIDAGVEPLLDTCGTGGDESNTFNISTVAAIVLAGGGVYIAKHGNRSVSSKCGSADVLESMGVPIDLTPEKVIESIKTNRFGFLFAPYYHPSMKNIAPIRRELGIRTIFNILGPLTNPARSKRQIIGVFSTDWVDRIASVLAKTGCKHGYVFSSEDGLDEVSPSARTRVCEIIDGKVVKCFWFHPRDVDLEVISLNAIVSSSIKDSIVLAEKIIQAEKTKATSVVLLNAAFGFLAADVCKDLKEGITLAQESINSGGAYKILQNLRNIKK
ncbi:MAG: anthranilate phosphoribosyltransferase [Candidatus Hydrogenedentota bacterium]